MNHPVYKNPKIFKIKAEITKKTMGLVNPRFRKGFQIKPGFKSLMFYYI